jgi:hypothetical protein
MYIHDDDDVLNLNYCYRFGYRHGPHLEHTK